MRSRRPGSKGTEWLLIKHRDEFVQPGYDINQYDYSVLTKRSLDEIARDAGAPEWQSNRPAAAGSAPAKNAWLAKSIATADRKKAQAQKTHVPTKAEKGAPPRAFPQSSPKLKNDLRPSKSPHPQKRPPLNAKKKVRRSSAVLARKKLFGLVSQKNRR